MTGSLPISLTRPLAFFDLETTGIDIAKDRIVQICIVRVDPNGVENTFKSLINPMMPIPPASTAIHGISDAMVAQAPKFKDVCASVLQLVQGADLAGYNSNQFDVPVLTEEFLRQGIDFPQDDTRMLDACTIFKKKEERTLKAALKFYCNEELMGAHDAENDVRATMAVFYKQLSHYPDLAVMSLDELHQYCIQRPVVDFAQRLTRNADGEIIFNFGQYRGKPVKDHPDYIRWMLNSDFPLHTKKILRPFVERPRT